MANPLAYTVSWWLRYVAPLSSITIPWGVEIDGVKLLTTAGHSGLISRTFFSRGAQCLPNCGRCCSGMSYQSRMVWIDEVPPRTIRAAQTAWASIAGSQPTMVLYEGFIQVADGTWQCKYVDPNSGACTIHSYPTPDRSRAPGCHLAPQLWPSTFRSHAVLGRRLPSRNWRWPRCPVNIGETTWSLQEHETSIKALTRLCTGLPEKLEVMKGLEALDKLGHESSPLNVFDDLAEGRSLLPIGTIVHHYRL